MHTKLSLIIKRAKIPDISMDRCENVSFCHVKKDMIKATGRSTFVHYAFDDNDRYAYKVIIDHKKSMTKARGRSTFCILCN